MNENFRFYFFLTDSHSQFFLYREKKTQFDISKYLFFIDDEREEKNTHKQANCNCVYFMRIIDKALRPFHAHI